MQDIKENNSFQLTIGAGLSIALSVLFYGLRICSRWHQEGKLDASDFLLGLGVVFTIGLDASLLWSRGPPIYTGTHEDLSNPVRFAAIMKGLLAIECVYVSALGFIKLSFLFLFLRIFPGRMFRFIVYFWVAIVIGWTIAVVIASIFQCSPVQALWDITLLPTARCFRVLNFYIAAWVPNIVTDLAIMLLPQYHVWKLQITLRTKIGLAFTFLLGSLAIIANVVRFTTLFSIDSLDATYTMGPLTLWTCLELAFGITCASLATFRPIVVLVIARTRSSTLLKSWQSSRFRSRSGYTKNSTQTSDTQIDRDHVALVERKPGSTVVHLTEPNRIAVTHTMQVSSRPR